MSPLRCNYCLKPMATEAGIKRHIAQSPACRKQWAKLLDRLKFTVSDNVNDQPPEQMNVDILDYPYEWGNAVDGIDGPDDVFDVPDGHLVHQTCVDVDPGPPNLTEPPSKHARVEEENEDSHCWPSSGRFTEQFPGIAATILGRKEMIFESLEAAELEKGESEWAPFCDEDEWELAQFLMKNLGQTKIDELLKLSHMWKSGVSFNNACSFLKCINSLNTGPPWICEMINVEGDVEGEDGAMKQEKVELW
ncbi:hypothetical protein SCLCIDRAFT_23311 [Scleroderma citrinum Foug A]|uniref:Uncharacterized protein n=1 Tax=Scleroderma citrinum Foug A TaxID=1036808 RepID=A0A0C3AI32_9AGAM|nr:hypothetical protein SCLCIDRAFT_23311 [Scleroderma citrinum Foug A]